MLNEKVQYKHGGIIITGVDWTIFKCNRWGLHLKVCMCMVIESQNRKFEICPCF